MERHAPSGQFYDAFATPDVARALRPIIGVEEFDAAPRACTITGTPGGDGWDVLSGGPGDDRLAGGRARDHHEGGDGRDRCEVASPDDPANACE